MNHIDHTPTVGARYGRLVVIRDEGRPRPNSHRRWLCRCDCGTERLIQDGNLRSGHSQSCGCLRTERIRIVNRTHGHTVNRVISPEFTAWWHIIERCENAKTRHYACYGGRGIRIAPAWRGSFEAFLRDMGARPSPQHSIDRINNDGHYEPGNCRWATKAVQMLNMRSNRLIQYRGITQPLAAWTRDLGLSYRAVHQRLRRGATIDQAFDRPFRRYPSGSKHVNNLEAA